MFCHEFILADLRVFDNCAKVCTGCDHVFNLAADMGGMGFIQSNHGVIFYNNTMISFNMLEAARKAGIKRCVREPARSGRAAAHVSRTWRCPLSRVSCRVASRGVAQQTGRALRSVGAACRWP